MMMHRGPFNSCTAILIILGDIKSMPELVLFFIDLMAFSTCFSVTFFRPKFRFLPFKLSSSFSVGEMSNFGIFSSMPSILYLKKWFMIAAIGVRRKFRIRDKKTESPYLVHPLTYRQVYKIKEACFNVKISSVLLKCLKIALLT